MASGERGAGRILSHGEWQMGDRMACGERRTHREGLFQQRKLADALVQPHPAAARLMAKHQQNTNAQHREAGRDG